MPPSPAAAVLDHASHRLGIGEVGTDDDMTLSRQLIRDAARAAGAHAEMHRHAVPGGGERVRHRRADPARAAGHEHGAACHPGEGTEAVSARSGRRASPSPRETDGRRPSPRSPVA